MQICILGAGRVGSAMAIDLAKDKQFDIIGVDRDLNALQKLKKIKGIATIQENLSKPATVKRLVSSADLVIDAVPGFLGFQTFKTVIESGKNVVDIAFFAEDPFELDALAKQNNVIAIMDCGVAPGMSNVLIGHVSQLLDEVHRAVIYVGGLPVIREWPYEYKAVFSPIDVIEEYTRPARYIENGHQVTREALSDPELLDFPGVGTLEAFNTDGLRTLIHTIDCPNMKEKTMRYPGHIDKMKVFRETGFFSEQPISLNGSRIRPIDFSSKLLFPRWELKEGEQDLTVMQIIVEGSRDGKDYRYKYYLLDRFNSVTKTTSMARTTGYTATVVARMICQGLYQEKGVSPPEYLGKKKECVQFILQGLKDRGIEYQETIEEIR
ncbi:MAG: saccharopine dehydrogenase C-terminal domain-containing protein [Calditrichota bacterium]